MIDRSAPVRVFAAGTFTHENRGDAALLASFRSLLERQFGSVELTLTSTRPDLDAGRIADRVVGMPLDPHGLAARLIHRLGNLAGPNLPGYLAAGQLALFDTLGPLVGGRLRREIDESDLVAFVPGGYLMAPEPNASLWLYHASSIIVGSHLHKPIVLFPGSYGPFTGVHAAVARRVLDRCNVILARECYSLAHLRALGLRRPTIGLVPDAAFAFRDDGRGELAIQRLLAGVLAAGRPLVGISAKPHHFPGATDAAQRWKRYVGALAAATRWCVSSGASVLFVPQSTGTAGEDRDAAREVLRLASDLPDVHVIDAELSAYELSALYGRLDLMIGTRMHANILSMAAGTPVVAIGYEHKTAGIMEMAGMEAFTVPIEEIDESRLVGIVADAWECREATRIHLRQTVPSLVSELQTGVASALASVCLPRAEDW